ncbi:MAG: histidine--tRNA ligase [Candidatus Norongarragalinales archaeon]
MTEQEKMQPPRGTRDYYGAEKRARDAAIAKLKSVFEKYGYAALETPALENWSTLAAKGAGGEEILKEAYKLVDQGGRALGLRYDLTVPFCRFIASNPRMPMPFKRYQIASVWRDGPVSSERLREFVQCDVDVAGASGMQADAEILAIVSDGLASFGLEFGVMVNNRKLLDGLLEYCGVDKAKWIPALLSVDKLEKIGGAAVAKELVEERGVSAAAAQKLLGLLADLKEMPAENAFAFINKKVKNKLAEEGVSELERVFAFANALGVKNLCFDASLARGLAYYTGTVFEAVLRSSKVKASVAGGGRYDDLIGAFLGGERKIPAVGASFGLERILEALAAAGKAEKAAVPARAFVIPIKATEAGLKVSRELREAGVCCSVDLLERSISKNLEWAGKQGYSFCVIVGEKELKAGKVKLRDMRSGEEKLCSIREAAAIIIG